MKQLVLRGAAFLATAVLILSVTAGAIAQEATQSEKEKRQLKNLYAMIINAEFCANLNMFFNSNDVESVKKKSIEITHDFQLTESEKNETWTTAVNSTEGALYFVNLGNHSEQIEYCSMMSGIYRAFSQVNNTGDGKSSERPF